MTAQTPRTLSKSQVLASRQCQRRLWLEVNHPELRDLDNAMLQRLREGRRHRRLHELYPGGVLIDPRHPLQRGPAENRHPSAADAAHAPVRATFSASGAGARRRDHPDPGERILTEIKSSTRVKPYHLIDCAIQHWVIDAASHPVSRVLLAHRPPLQLPWRRLRRTAAPPMSPEQSPRCYHRCRAVGGGRPRHAGKQHRARNQRRPHCTDPLACPFRRHCEPHNRLPAQPVAGRRTHHPQLRAKGSTTYVTSRKVDFA